MGRILEAMKDFWEGVGGFLALGGRDFANRISILVRGGRIRRLNKALAAQLIDLGRKAWERRLLTSEAYPVVEKIETLQSGVKQKTEAVNEVKARAAELEEQRRQHLSMYQKKISEQLKLKQPVDAEKTGILVEVKRLRRELAATGGEINNLAGKMQLLQKRIEEFKAEQWEKGGEYVLTEIRQEIEFNQRFQTLKKEKYSFLESKLQEHFRRVEKVDGVVNQFEERIEELRKNEREGTAQIDSALEKLRTSRRQIERDIKRLKREMTPIFGELGAELVKRPFDDGGLRSHYSETAKIELEIENQRKSIAQRRSDSASIGLGVKFGFYGMILALIVLIIWLVLILV